MKNKSLIIIVISLFFIAGLFGAEKTKSSTNDFPVESERLVSGILTPYGEMGFKAGFMDAYRPIYTKKLDHQKSE